MNLGSGVYRECSENSGQPEPKLGVVRTDIDKDKTKMEHHQADKVMMGAADLTLSRPVQ